MCIAHSNYQNRLDNICNLIEVTVQTYLNALVVIESLFAMAFQEIYLIK